MAAKKLVLEDLADEIVETDVLIIGGGLAGSTAAIRLKEDSTEKAKPVFHNRALLRGTPVWLSPFT